MKVLFESWKKFLHEGIQLTEKEKAEAERLLGMAGFQLEQRMQMVLQNAAAQPVYEKILGAYQAGIYDEKGITKAAEMLEIAPQLTPLQGDFEKEVSKSVVFEEGEYLTAIEWTKIEKYIEIYNRTGRDILKVAAAIRADSKYNRMLPNELSGLFRRLKDYGSFRDETRGVFYGRGGFARAEEHGYVIRPEDGAEIKHDSRNQAHKGTRLLGYPLLKSLKYVSRES